MITLSHITKQFTLDAQTITALSDVSLHMPAGQIYGVIGASGAGKSTLIRRVNLLERLTSGTVMVNGIDLTNLPERKLIDARRQIAIIFQHFNLLSSRTLAGNVALPLELDNLPKSSIARRVSELLALVGLVDKADSYPEIFRAAKSNGSPSRVRWPVIPKCCCATKPPARWSPLPPTQFWRY